MEAVLHADCRICLEVDDGVRKALHKDSSSSVEGAPSSKRSLVTSGPLPNKCLRNNFSFRWCAMRHPCRKIFAILGLSPSVVSMCANESALGLQCAQALHTSCFLPATISVSSHDPGNPSPMGVRLFHLGINFLQILENAVGRFGSAAAVCTLQLMRAFNDVFLPLSVGCFCKLPGLLWPWRHCNGSLR